MGCAGSLLFDLREYGRSHLWVLRGDRCLILRFGRSGFVGDEGRSLFGLRNRRSDFG
jgi:hypothetical protein